MDKMLTCLNIYKLRNAIDLNRIKTKINMAFSIDEEDAFHIMSYTYMTKNLRKLEREENFLNL